MCRSYYSTVNDGGPFRPGLAHALIAANVAVFAWWMLKSDDRWWQRFFYKHMLLSNARLREGRLETLVTHMFMHGNLLHLFFNMICLHSFGRHAEALLGPRRFLGLYFASGLAGALAQLQYNAVVPGLRIPASYTAHRDASSAGASAALAGIVMCMLAMNPSGTVILVFVPVPNLVFAPLFIGWSAYCAYTGDSNSWAHAAHLGGAVTGLAYASALRMRWR